MDDLTISTESQFETGESRGVEQQSLNDATYEPSMLVENNGDYEKSEFVQNNFETLVEILSVIIGFFCSLI